MEEKPDEGRAWLIAIAACIINMILSGISRMIGMLFVAVIDVYGVSRQEATMPFSVRNSIRCLAGPLVGLVGLHYKIRNITFCGGIVAALGAALCCIAPNVMWLTIFWGVIHGSGFAFANTLFQVVVNQYFLKHRATASGIALSGACVGSLVFPFMIEAILEKYGLHGSFLIIGGLVMNVLPPALLLVPPPWIKNNQQTADNVSTNNNENVVLENGESIGDLRSSRVLHSQSFSNCPSEGIPVVQKSASFTYKKKMQSSNENTLPEYQNGQAKCQPISENVMSICGLSATEEENTMNGASVFTIEGSSLANSVVPEATPPGVESSKPVKEEKCSELLTNMMSIVRLYRNPAFLLISLCMVAYIIIFIPMLAVIVDYSKDKGLPEKDGKFFISAMALGDLIGRLGFGWVTDRGYMSISNFMMISLLLQGVVVIMFPLAKSFYTLSGLLILYGVTAGSVLILFPVLVLKHVSMKDQPIAMGCVGFLSGMVTFGLPPFIGHFRDDVGSYDGMFYITASVSIISGVLWLLEPVATKYEKKRALKELAQRR